jgi:hypothetical protein
MPAEGLLLNLAMNVRAAAPNMWRREIREDDAACTRERHLQ